jgi:peptidyl-prolyl cis-trans isomerase-like 4
LTEEECREKGFVVALELFGLGSQFLISTTQGPDRALDGYRANMASSLSSTTKPATGFFEDENHTLDRLADCYADSDERPFADWRIKRALVVHDPFEDPRAMTCRSVSVTGTTVGRNRQTSHSSGRIRLQQQR